MWRVVAKEVANPASLLGGRRKTAFLNAHQERFWLLMGPFSNKSVFETHTLKHCFCTVFKHSRLTTFMQLDPPYWRRRAPAVLPPCAREPQAHPRQAPHLSPTGTLEPVDDRHNGATA
ncbi:protein of unknown function [Thauera humireducens]|jgi:hypothetical protein|nr:protein of unknown function [Thauera humireducens]